MSHRDAAPGDPFAVALREAIRRRGLGLDRIQQRLQARGTTISVAALSYWQSGRRRPERAASMVALRHLEEVLDVAPGSLTELLGAPRPRGRSRRGATTRPLAELWHESDRIEALLSRVHVDCDDELTRVTLHVIVELAADRGVRAVRTRQVLRAEVDGPDRWISIHDLTEPGWPIPRVLPVSGCSVGRIEADEETGMIAAELVFERPLSRGETVVVEHASVLDGPPYPRGNDSYGRVFRSPIRDYVIEIRFDPRALPVACHRFTTTPDDPDGGDRRRLPVNAEGAAHAVALNFGPGTFSVAWEWPD
ncbi:hypothetical protein GCM10022243_57740 [Saccharothrix violaceirubra]|uniref:Uncharacterized protein n=1 Tax=Saccharothrix violaceirubra TaxID=413306 RepID=A0A7W7WVX2_9PSEU|nr:hypothetical protein [Saccharothrix violaceirubra]MBB4965794.1 hypothetical protein [Saccharothrix violaceirubra]